MSDTISGKNIFVITWIFADIFKLNSQQLTLPGPESPCLWLPATLLNRNMTLDKKIVLLLGKWQLFPHYGEA